MKFKRFLTGAFFVVCMIFMSCFVVSAASSGTYGQNCTWTLDDEGTLTISGSGITPNYSKDMYRYIPWYSHMAEIKKAVIDGPENIGDRAFFYARNMKEVVIGSSVKSIGEAVFTGCTSLKNIDIPSNVTKIYSSAFSGCTGITKLTIPDSVTTLGSKALEDMTSLQELTVPFIGTAIDNLGHLGWWFQSSTTKVPGYTWTSYNGKYYLIPRTLTKITVTSCRVRPYGFNNCEFVTDRSIKDHTGGRATCASPAVCEVCGQTYGEKDASNHTGETEIKNAINATCLEAGYTGDIYCKGCKELLETGTETKALGHDMTREVSAKVEPTCYSEGKEAVIGCSRCNHTEGGAVIAKTAHTWDAGTITKEATCTVKGEKTFRCTAAGCDATRTEKTAVNPENHVNTEVIKVKEATCTETGYTGDTYCTDCKKTIETGTETKALGHDMTREVSAKVEPTCYSEGKEAVIGCSRCNHTEGGAVIAKTAHTWDAGTITKEATCTVKGEKTFRCTAAGCDATRTEKTAVNPENHVNTEVINVKEATCTEAGYTGDTYCTDCKKTIETGTETIALGHDMTREVSTRVEPTCHSEGKEAVIGCSRCNHTEGGAVIAKTDHTWDAGTITKEATCTVKGEKTFRCTAAGCDATRTEKTAVNPENHVNTEVINVKEATCTEAGYTGDTYCTDCKKTIETGTETIALGHDMTREVSAKVEPTCEIDGKEVVIGCSRCDYIEGGAVLKAFGHIWDEGKVTKEPDENSEGVKTYTCEKCNKTKTESIPKKESTQKPQPSQPVQKPEPTQKPQTTQKPQPTQKPQQSQTNVGRTDDKKTGKYVIINAKRREVAYSAPVSKNKKTVTIPNTVKISGVTYKVTQIADNAFRNNKKITKVTIGKNVSKIGSYAFSGCKKLKTIIIKTRKLTTKTVSRKAFTGTPKKITVKVPANKMKTYKKLLKKKGLKSKKIVKG